MQLEALCQRVQNLRILRRRHYYGKEAQLIKSKNQGVRILDTKFFMYHICELVSKK